MFAFSLIVGFIKSALKVPHIVFVWLSTLSGQDTSLAMNNRINRINSHELQARLKALKLGKGRVFEQGFSMIIGWNDRILPLVDQVTPHARHQEV